MYIYMFVCVSKQGLAVNNLQGLIWYINPYQTTKQPILKQNNNKNR